MQNRCIVHTAVVDSKGGSNRNFQTLTVDSCHIVEAISVELDARTTMIRQQAKLLNLERC